MLIHGGNLGWGQWYPNIDELAKKFKVFAIDLPGGGRSSRVDFERLNFDKGLISIVESFILTLKLEKTDVVAASVGGWIAGQIAIRKK